MLQRCAKRGNLRLFFGGSGGRTAVRTMLETASGLRASGVDIVVGCVGTSGCEAIERLLGGFECLGGIDAAKARTPSIVLIDTRAPAFNDEDSWSEIEVIVACGIHVWASLDATGFSSWTTVGAGIPARLDRLSLL